jgi:hypothetical protein
MGARSNTKFEFNGAGLWADPCPGPKPTADVTRPDVLVRPHCCPGMTSPTRHHPRTEGLYA